MRIKFFTITLLLFVSFNSNIKAQYNTVEENLEPRKIKREINNYDFIDKGTWMTGGQFAFSTKDYDSYKFLFLEDWVGSSYNFSVSPYVMYAFRKNTGVGMKFTYERSESDLNGMTIIIDGEELTNLQDAYDIEHMFYSTIFLRNYLGLEKNSRFGLYVDTELSYGYGQGKATNGVGEDLSGTYSTINEIKLGVTPGLTAFINENFAVELFINLIGLSVKDIRQYTDQVETGKHTKANANFKINLLSIGFSTSVYF